MWEQPEQIKIQFRNKLKQTEVWECLLSLSAESFAFQSSTQKYED
jgi:hypothetical protein